MDAAVLALTSARIFEHILDRCIQIRSRNFEIFQPNQYAALAACVQAFLHGSIGVRLPCTKVWAHALLDDPVTATSYVSSQTQEQLATKIPGLLS